MSRCADKLPAVLYQPNGNSLAVRRVLKMAIDLLSKGDYPKDLHDKVEICIDDLETLSKNIHN